MLTNEPVYFGQPILAVAATDEDHSGQRRGNDQG